MVRRTKEEARETRNRILDAAEQVFYDKGVSRTTLADIAAQAGVTRGAIYWHFANKGDLFTAMFDRVLLPLDELSADGDETSDPLGRIAHKMRWCMSGVTTDTQRRRVFDILFLKCEFVDEMGPVKARHQASMEEGVGKIEADIALAVQKGQLPADVDTRRAAHFLHAMVGGFLREALMMPPSVYLASQIDALVDACLDTLRLSPAMRKNKTS